MTPTLLAALILLTVVQTPENALRSSDISAV